MKHKHEAAVLRKTGAMDQANHLKLTAIKNAAVHQFVADAIELCRPESVFICSDSTEDIRYIREQAVASGEEKTLAIKGHTFHFDGMQDQGRDREVTRYLVPRTDSLSKTLNQVEREQGLAEIRGLLNGSMKGRTMIVRFLSLGPTNSVFSIPCVQCTDSFYVAHSEDLLYRPAYEQFKLLEEKADCFRIIHSAGKMNENMVSVESDKKRIYIDYTHDTIYSVNTQYAGNTVGLKKLAFRLTIQKADREGWLAEHMFLMGVHGPNGRKTYFAGAFPSACGKTSTAMLPGETILGDDIAYFRHIDGEARAVNAEAGIFGIIQNVAPTSDPAIYEVLTNPGEVIFSNVLIKENKPYWLGMGSDLPKDGVNFSGAWQKGKTDAQGNEIPPAHKNARYTVSLKALANCDPELENPVGAPVRGIIYGGRDAVSYVPVQQSFDWDHGIIAYGASLETETTFAILGKEGVPEINIMSIQDFLAIPLGKYIRNNLNFAKGLKKTPLVFGVNYFLRDKAGEFVTGVRDKAVWVKWMERRVHGEMEAIRGPTGWIPKYDDLKPLFRQVLDKDYAQEDYVKQFTIRIPENLAKMDRIEKFYRAEVSEASPPQSFGAGHPALRGMAEPSVAISSTESANRRRRLDSLAKEGDTPPVLLDILKQQRQRLLAVQKQHGDYVSPLQLA